MNKLLSVIIPTYRRTDSLKRLLLLLESQTIVSSLDILVIDQNGKDFLEKEIQLSGFSNIRHIWQEKPNASLARNAGAKNSVSDYLLFLDDDLVPDSDFCEKGMIVFQNYDFVECFVPMLRNEGKNSSKVLESKRIMRGMTKGLIEIADAMSAAIFIKKNAYYRSGGFDELLFDFAKTAEDQEFFLRLPWKGIRLHYAASVSILHDETQPGGCDLRTVDYWITRNKCIRSWVYRFRIHRGGNMDLTFSDYFNLCRAAFFNRAGFASGIGAILKQIRLFKDALSETEVFLRNHKSKYKMITKIDHLS